MSERHKKMLRDLVERCPDMLAKEGDMPGPEDLNAVQELEAVGLLDEGFFAGGGAMCWTVSDRGRKLLSE